MLESPEALVEALGSKLVEQAEPIWAQRPSDPALGPKMSDEASYALPVAGLRAIGDPGNKGVEGQIAALGLGQELPGVFAQIGRPALAPLQAYLADRSHSEWVHSLVAHALGEIGQQHLELLVKGVTVTTRTSLAFP